MQLHACNEGCMLKKLSKRSGSKYTFLSIVLILAVVYFMRFAGVSKAADYPQEVFYKDYKYQYSQTINDFSYKFVRKYGISYKGYVLLLRRGENWDTAPSKVYIFAGWRKYREYVLTQQVNQ